MSEERNKAGMRERSPNGQTMHNKIQYNNNKHIFLVFYKIWKKFNEIQLTKNKIDLKNQKMKNHPPSADNVCNNKNNYT